MTEKLAKGDREQWWRKRYDRCLENNAALRDRLERSEAFAGTLRALLNRWLQFDFDCPEEEDDTYEEDGTALARLYDDTAAVLVKKTEVLT